MATPGEFSPPPTSTDPATGARVLTGAGSLAWSLDTLDLGGDIRGKFIRLQDWVRNLAARQGAEKPD